MGNFNKYGFATLMLVLAQGAYAVEINPEIGFRQSQSPNGSQYDAGAAYRSQLLDQNNLALNNKLFSQNQITKMVPDINSVGLNFTFKVD